MSDGKVVPNAPMMSLDPKITDNNETHTLTKIKPKDVEPHRTRRGV